MRVNDLTHEVTLTEEEYQNLVNKYPNDFDKHIRQGDEIIVDEDGARVNISQLKRVAKKRDRVSDELKEAAEKYADHTLAMIDPEFAETNYNRHTKMKLSEFNGLDIEVAFIDGAKWQKEKSKKDISEAIDNSWAQGYNRGNAKMKEQMMKNVISDGSEHSDWLGLYEGVWQKIVDLGLTELSYKGNGDKVKLIIIKED